MTHKFPSLSEKQLKEIIELGEMLDKVCESATFSLRYANNGEGQRNSIYLADPGALKLLLTKLEQIRYLMPIGICDLESRNKDTTMIAMFGKDEESVYDTVTKNGLVDPEKVIGFYKKNLKDINILRNEIKEIMKQMQHKGMLSSAGELGQLVFSSQLAALNCIANSEIFTYQEKFSDLQKNIATLLKKLESKKKEPIQGQQLMSFTAGSKMSKHLAQNELLNQLKALVEKLNATSHPGIVFEYLKKFISTLELLDEKRLLPVFIKDEVKLARDMLIFMKNHSTAEEFANHISDINKYINEEIQKAEKILHDTTYKIQDKYDITLSQRSSKRM